MINSPFNYLFSSCDQEVYVKKTSSNSRSKKTRSSQEEQLKKQQEEEQKAWKKTAAVVGIITLVALLPAAAGAISWYHSSTTSQEAGTAQMPYNHAPGVQPHHRQNYLAVKDSGPLGLQTVVHAKNQIETPVPKNKNSIHKAGNHAKFRLQEAGGYIASHVAKRAALKLTVSEGGKVEKEFLQDFFEAAEANDSNALWHMLEDVKEGEVAVKSQDLPFILETALQFAPKKSSSYKLVLERLQEIAPQRGEFIKHKVDSLKAYEALGKEEKVKAKNPKICLLTAYTKDNPERVVLSKKVVANQKAYAEQKGYQYVEHDTNLAIEVLADGTEVTLEPYWSKISAINQILNGVENQVGEKPEWIVWMDDDLVVTNANFRIEDILLQQGVLEGNTHVIVTQDSMSHAIPEIPLNTAMIFVKNDSQSREFFKKLWNMHKTEIPNRSYTYGDCPNQTCLHEQQALTDMVKNDPSLDGFVKIIPQRDPVSDVGVNLFHRWNHYDINRSLELSYGGDHPSTRFDKNDPKAAFVQCTGLATNGVKEGEQVASNQRLKCIDELLKTAADNSVSPNSNIVNKKVSWLSF